MVRGNVYNMDKTHESLLEMIKIKLEGRVDDDRLTHFKELALNYVYDEELNPVVVKEESCDKSNSSSEDAEDNT